MPQEVQSCLFSQLAPTPPNLCPGARIPWTTISAVDTVDTQKRIRSHDWGWLLWQGELARRPARSGYVCLLVSQHEAAALLSPPAAPFGTPTVPICFFPHWKAVNSVSHVCFTLSGLLLFSLLVVVLNVPVLILSSYSSLFLSHSFTVSTESRW